MKQINPNISTESIPPVHPMHRGSHLRLIFGMLICLMAGLFGSIISNRTTAYADDALTGIDLSISQIVYAPEAENSVTAIHPNLVNGQWYLFLPSTANFSALRMSGPETLTLSPLSNSITFSGTSSYINVNATSLFSETMVAGTEYSVVVYDSVSGDSASLILMKSANLPTMYVTLADKEGAAIDLSWIHEGTALTKGNAATSGDLYIISKDNSTLVHTTLESFKGRGNSSWDYSGDKKGYNIKLSEKKELISGAGKAKSWCLLSGGYNRNLAGYIDRTHLSNIFAFEFYNTMNGDAALTCQPIDLYVNNDYRGTYLLTEKVQINSERVNISESEYKTAKGGEEDKTNKTVISAANAPTDPAILAGIQKYQYATNSKPNKKGGYLLEIDFRYQFETSYFITRKGTTIVLKEPEYASKEQVQQIAIYVQQLEDALYSETGYAKGKHYSELLDIESMAKRYILDCITGQKDIMDASSYFYIDLDDQGELSSPMKAGPAWDYDYIDNTLDTLYVTNATGTANRKVWVDQLLTKGDFVAQLDNLSKGPVKTLWTAMKNSTNANNETVYGKVYQKYLELKASQEMNFLRFAKFSQNTTYTYNANIYTNFINNRFGTWYNTLWASTQLTGVTIQKTSTGLTSTVHGTANSLRWVTVDENNSLQVPVISATGKSLTNLSCGTHTYMLCATGSFNGKTRTMYSNPVTVTTAHVYNDIEFLWNPDNTCKVQSTCTNCSHVFRDNATVNKTVKAATYFEKGSTTCTATYTFNGQVKSSVQTTYTEAKKLPASDLQSLENTATGVKLTWKSVTDATGYYIYRDGTQIATITSGKTVSYLDCTATAGKLSNYQVQAYIKSGDKVSCSEKSVVRQYCRVAKPALTAATAQQNNVRVTWTKQTGITGYILYRSANNGSYQPIAILASSRTAYNDTTVTSGNMYRYRIAAYKDQSLTSYRSVSSAIKTVTFVQAPTLQSVVNNAAGKVTVTWNKVSKVTGYQLRYVANGKTKTITIKDASKISRVISKLTKKTTYSFSIRSYVTVSGKIKYSAWSKTIKRTIKK